jgi:diketogulonate reductase-like aldo/keto reductase
MTNTQLSSIRLTLNENVSMPMLGLGTLNMGDDQTLINAIKYAINLGYRHFDCAWVYGNEKVIGRGIEEAIKESKGKVKREDLFIVSKVWNTHHSKENVRKSYEESCANLRVEYLDLFLIHWPTGFKENTGTPFPVDPQTGDIIDSGISYLETYHALEDLQKENRVRSIGVSNFNKKQLQDVLNNCTIKPAINQLEVNPYYQNDALIEFCHKNNVNVTAYAPFGVGMKHMDRPDLPLLVQHPVLVNIGRKHNKTAAQICLRWLLQRNISTIPKSTTPQRILENSEVFDFHLTDDEFKQIKQLNLNVKSEVYKAYVNTDTGKFNLAKHPFYPFHE